MCHGGLRSAALAFRDLTVSPCGVALCASGVLHWACDKGMRKAGHHSACRLCVQLKFMGIPTYWTPQHTAVKHTPCFPDVAKSALSWLSSCITIDGSGCGSPQEMACRCAEFSPHALFLDFHVRILWLPWWLSSSVRWKWQSLATLYTTTADAVLFFI